MCIGSVVVVGKTGGHDEVMNGLCATLKKICTLSWRCWKVLSRHVKSDLQFRMSALAVGDADRAQKVLFHMNRGYFSFKLSLAPVEVRGVRITHPH